MNDNVINFSEKLRLIKETWKPKIIAQMNDYHFKLVKLEGDFTWHDHKETDEVFIVLEGTLRIDFEEESKTLNEGELLVIQKGVLHKPFAERECKVLLVEPAGTVNTGDAGGAQTAADDVWI